MNRAIPQTVIRDSFSAASQNYDNYSAIQRRIAKELLGRLLSEERTWYSVLDIGTGTGELTCGLSELESVSQVFGLDLAWGMIKKAQSKGLKLLAQSDAEDLPFRDKKFDLVISNLVYQWVFDLGSAFSEVRRVLREDGEFCFSTFGRDTLYELKECMQGMDNFSDFVTLPTKDIIYNKLKMAGFSNIEIISAIEPEYFTDLFAILRWLKLLGVNYRGVRFSGLAASGILRKMDKLYSDNFYSNGKVVVSFEKILIKAGRF